MKTLFSLVFGVVAGALITISMIIYGIIDIVHLFQGKLEPTFFSILKIIVLIGCSGLVGWGVVMLGVALMIMWMQKP